MHRSTASALSDVPLFKASALFLALIAVLVGCAPAPIAPDLDALRSAAPERTYDDGPVRYVIHISVDGLRPDAITRHDPAALPNFYRLRAEGAFSDNARTDVDYGNTLPNHMAQLTGRTVLGDGGHGWTDNHDPAPGETLHTRKGGYVASTFDVVHDHGLRTGAYVSKSKFALLDRSYDDDHGAPDLIGADEGRDKIDAFVYDPNSEDLVERFVRDMGAEPYAYTFLHLRDPDSKGHAWGWRLWGWHPYMRAVRKMDALLGDVLSMVDRDPRLAGRTVVILTSDHGGSGHGHGAEHPAHYTIPFYVWGSGVPASDLYDLNGGLRQEPGTNRPAFDAPLQPIRNGDAANLALSLLNLPVVPGSTLSAEAPLRVVPPDVLRIDASEESLEGYLPFGGR